MSNRTFQQKVLTLVKKEVHLYCWVAVGAAGAVTLKKRQFTAQGATSVAPSSSIVNAPTVTAVGNPYAIGDGPIGGVRTVVRNSAGNWTVTLLDNYQFLISASVDQVFNANGLVTSGFAVGVVSGNTNVTTNTAPGNGGVINVVLNNGSGAATDPANGDTVVLRFVFGDATEP